MYVCGGGADAQVREDGGWWNQGQRQGLVWGRGGGIQLLRVLMWVHYSN